jgi:endonuclease/exonuclease/phosphatase family metal-dependent hydrolase
MRGREEGKCGQVAARFNVGAYRALVCGGAFLACVLAGVQLRGEQVTLATYNLENYVTVGRMVEGVYRQNYPKPEEEKTALRAVIESLQADVLVFQEMGPWPFLKELQRDLAREQFVYPYAELLEAADEERHLAILSRKPFVRLRKHQELQFQYFGARQLVKRGLLEVTLKIGQSEVTVFAVHLKSRITERSEDDNSTLRRTEEARMIRDCILREYARPASSLVLLLGDCNDVPRSKPLTALLHRGKTVLFEMLPAEDSRGEVWTHWYRREDSYSRIDYALVSPGLKPTVVAQRATIADGPATLIASDHRPLKVTLELP